MATGLSLVMSLLSLVPSAVSLPAQEKYKAEIVTKKKIFWNLMVKHFSVSGKIMKNIVIVLAYFRGSVMFDTQRILQPF